MCIAMIKVCFCNINVHVVGLGESFLTRNFRLYNKLTIIKVQVQELIPS